MRFTWLYRCNDVLNAGLNKLWVRNFIFKNYTALFLAMISILGRCRLPVIVALVGLGIMSDLLRRKKLFKPSNSIEDYLEYEKGNFDNPSLDRDLCVKGYQFIFRSINLSACTILIYPIIWLLLIHSDIGSAPISSAVRFLQYISPHIFFAKFSEIANLTTESTSALYRRSAIWVSWWLMILYFLVFYCLYPKNTFAYFKKVTQTKKKFRSLIFEGAALSHFAEKFKLCYLLISIVLYLSCELVKDKIDDLSRVMSIKVDLLSTVSLSIFIFSIIFWFLFIYEEAFNASNITDYVNNIRIKVK